MATYLCQLILTVFVLAGLYLDAAQATELLRLHVSPAGKDQNDGGEASPLATPHEAASRLPELARKSPAAAIEVIVHKGTYPIEQPIVIGPKHVPAQGSVKFKGEPAGEALISGGRAIAGWSMVNGAWTVNLAARYGDRWTFRELFVDGIRRPRARHPNQSWLRVEKAFDDKRTGFVFRAGDFPPSWTAGGELVFLHDWSTSRIPIKSVVHDSRRLTVAFPIGNRADHFRIDNFEPHPRYAVENHRSFLDAPGEWLLDDAGLLTYLPLPGEQPESTNVVAPFARGLFEVAGVAGAPIRNVHLEGLRFEYCHWPIPERGFAGTQATAHERRDDRPSSFGRHFVPAAISFELAEHCSVVRCRIAHLGTSGIQFGSQTRACVLEDSLIEDISGNGVNLGEDSSRSVDGRPWWQAAPQQAAAGHKIARNRIERCGQQFFGAVAIWAGLARELVIEQNEIANHPYTGVSLGWMWNSTPTPAGGSVVARNHIHHVMQLLSDGGGIYTLGRQPGARLVENVIHDVPVNAGRAESNGMFLDEGSDQFDIVGNTIFNVARSPLRFHRAESLTVQNNTLVVPDAGTPPLRYNNTKPETIKQVDNRVIVQADFDAKSISVPATGPGKPK